MFYDGHDLNNASGWFEDAAGLRITLPGSDTLTLVIVPRPDPAYADLRAFLIDKFQ